MWGIRQIQWDGGRRERFVGREGDTAYICKSSSHFKFPRGMIYIQIQYQYQQYLPLIKE